VEFWWRHVCPNARQVRLRGYYTIVPLQCGPPKSKSDSV
jgi:hypothetical protein